MHRAFHAVVRDAWLPSGRAAQLSETPAHLLHCGKVMLIPPIARYMTRQPWTIPGDAKLSQARELMRKHHVRHLPVLEAGKLVGILSERDGYLYDRLEGLDAEIAVSDAMTVDVYAVRDKDLLDDIVDTMAAHKYGSVVVMDGRGNVEGIFTTVDGLQMLANVLRRDA